jgi:hypothetical protein
MSETFKEWVNVGTFQSRSFTCGHCGKDVSANKGFYRTQPKQKIFICHHCGQPTFFSDSEQVPGATYGKSVGGIDDTGVSGIYEEARKAVGSGSATAAVLCCRKLLMHVAVSKGAKEGETFASYVEFLATKNYVPPDAKEWVDHIRKIGNEANHEIKLMTPADAKELIDFCEMLLKVIYEFPSIVRAKLKPTS